MPPLARCPYCGQSKAVPDDSIGMSARCTKCRQDYVIILEGEPFKSRNPGTLSDYSKETDYDPATGSDSLRGLHSGNDSLSASEMPRILLANRPQSRNVTNSAQVKMWILFGLAAVLAIGAGLAASIAGWSTLVLPFTLAGIAFGGTVLILLLRQ